MTDFRAGGTFTHRVAKDPSGRVLDLTPSQVRLLLQLLDKAWWEEDKKTQRQEGDSFYMADLEAIQEKLK